MSISASFPARLEQISTTVQGKFQHYNATYNRDSGLVLIWQNYDIILKTASFYLFFILFLEKYLLDSGKLSTYVARKKHNSITKRIN